jgi:hypothetical protein
MQIAKKEFQNKDTNANSVLPVLSMLSEAWLKVCLLVVAGKFVDVFWLPGATDKVLARSYRLSLRGKRFACL